jgi:hypothetical protein
MILMTHIIIALTSVIYTCFVLVSPSSFKIRGSYALIALTLISGTILVVESNAHLVRACMTGIVYVAVMLFGIALAQYRLASQETTD